ncbi:hypothetical protein [Flammeovirga sp. SJP92]|uniref:hypothetical protein n=1 Tax=Flammeovirga sp. SJP92 TaxID=1775430 RepID=UPI0007887574|nr:hypothetical protein [Flammeovirga sp. SJP92]KXX66873.1 hypothetical protein AVL50_30545 [Flammeovirga sp. SJP92]
MKGYKELRKVFTSYGLEPIHKAFAKLEEEGELFQINGISNLMILIGGHDSGEAFPILVRGI